MFAFISAAVMLTAVSCSAKPETSVPAVKLNEPKISEDGLPIITVGTIGYVDPLLTDPFQKPRDMDIEVIHYGAEVDKSLNYEEQYDATIRALDTALISGEVPDILMLPVQEVTRLNRQGTFTDLLALMDEYDGYKREDFTDCALEGLTVDGKMPALMDSYFIYTAAAKTKYVPKEYQNWTADDAMKFYSELPKNMAFGEYSQITDMADYMLKNEGLGCIDMKSGKCDFSGAFTKLLDFCDKNIPETERGLNFGELSDSDLYFYMEDQQKRGRNDAQLVYPIRICGFISDYAQDTYGYFGGEDITFVGYPSENGRGAYIEPNQSLMYCITEKSCNKELAWKLVNNMIKHRPKLEENMSVSTFGVSVLKKRLQEEYDLPERYNNSINREWQDWTNEFEEIKLTQEYKEMLWKYLLSVPADPYQPVSLRNMIEEEYAPVIEDNRTAEEAAHILQNRIETYLSEKS